MIDLKMIGKIIVRGTIKAETGLHIGGSPTGLEIGGVDNPIIKDHEGKPYIPGSSLKGKMRNLLEKSEGLVSSSNLVVTKRGGENDTIRMHMCNTENCPVCNLFGRTNGRKDLADGSQLTIGTGTPSRLIVRDAYLIEESIPHEVKDNIDLEWTEVKWENSIDRITSAANPRQTERVPRGAEFAFELIYTIYTAKDKENFNKVGIALKLLEDDYLGGSGSRGYGQISFKGVKLFWNSVEDYEIGNVNLKNKEPWLEGETLGEIMEMLANSDKLQAIK